jgi:hypothetical protein
MQEGLSTPNYINLEYFFYKIYMFFANIWHFLTRPEVLAVFKFIAQVLIVVGFAFIFYWLIRLEEMKKERNEKLRKVIIPEADTDHTDPRLRQITAHLVSDNPSDWKLAIIEADVILDEAVARIRPLGQNLGERLKSMNRAEHPWLAAAWEAHAVRNRIAHDGSAFTISRTEARRVIGLYQQVFEVLGILAKE